MFGILNLSKALLLKLTKKAYRDAYVAEHVRRGIATQIRSIREEREWKQGDFSKRLDKPQSVVSRLEDPSYGKVTIQTLLEVASVFDVALQVRFVPYSTFLQQTRDVSTAAMQAASFEDELASATKALVLKPMSEILTSGTFAEFDVAQFNALDDDSRKPDLRMYSQEELYQPQLTLQ